MKMCRWRCDSCDRVTVCDPVCSDEDDDGEGYGIGPECIHCDEVMDYDGEEIVAEIKPPAGD